MRSISKGLSASPAPGSWARHISSNSRILASEIAPISKLAAAFSWIISKISLSYFTLHLQSNPQRFEQQKAQNDRIIGELSKNMYGLNLSVGRLIETLIAARLWEKFAAYPYNLNRAYRRMPIFGEGGRTLAEIDILLADTEWVMAVEVKREYDDGRDLTRHLQRMDQIRQHPPRKRPARSCLAR